MYLQFEAILLERNLMQMNEHKLLLKGGRVIDSSRDLNGYFDVLIIDGRIDKVEKDMGQCLADEVLDVSGMYVVPGLIDMHTHVYPKGTNLGIFPDSIGVDMGVHTVVDAGSAGALNFENFRDNVIKKAKTEVYEFLNISKYGLKYGKGELSDLKNLDFNLNRQVIAKNREYIKGIKARASASVVGEMGITPIKMAKDFAKEMGLPLMVHIGNAPPRLGEVLDILEEGDIVTHIYHGKPGGLFNPDGTVLKEAADAYGRGVIFDVGHGNASFSFNVAEKAIKMGYKPITISTDLHIRNVNTSVRSLLLTMSKLLSLGLEAEYVLKCVTVNPAKILKLDKSITPENKADIAVLKIEEDPIEVQDSDKFTRILQSHFDMKYMINTKNVTKF